jgi:uncharacterized damage-inducible protein DinB
MKVKLNSEQELLSVARELFHVLTNLRHWSSKWEQEHGSDPLAAKKKWERKADDLLAKYQVTKTHIKQEIKIEVDATEDTKKED